MICDGVCMRNMHILMDVIYLFVVGDGTYWVVIGMLQWQ